MTRDDECILVSDGLSLEQLKDLVRDVAPQYRFVRVYLFGSRARGDYRSDSDYDFYVSCLNSYFHNGFLMKIIYITPGL